MGNHRLRLSDMIPNAWFYKLKGMGRSRTRNQNINSPRKKKPPQTKTSSSFSPSSSSTSSSSASSAYPPQQSKTEQPYLLSHQRKSYYFTRELNHSPQPDPPLHFPEPPRKSSKQRRNGTRRSRASSPKLAPPTAVGPVSKACGCGVVTEEPVWAKPDSTSEEYPNSPPDSSSDSGLPATSFDGMVSMSSTCKCRTVNDAAFTKNYKSLDPKLDGFDRISNLELPPIITKNPAKFGNAVQEIKNKKKMGKAHGEQRTSPVLRRVSASSPGMRLRTNSPRIGARRIRKSGSGSRPTLSESFAVVKTSVDPQKDFRDSMVEMILENNIRASKDLEDLLACYLQLNSDEYHNLIIKVFKQIWFDLAHVRLKD